MKSPTGSMAYIGAAQATGVFRGEMQPVFQKPVVHAARAGR